MFDGVEIGRDARIRRAVIDKDVKIPPRFIVGYDLADDRKRFAVTESGIVVIPKRELVEPLGTIDSRLPIYQEPDQVRIA